MADQRPNARGCCANPEWQRPTSQSLSLSRGFDRLTMNSPCKCGGTCCGGRRRMFELESSYGEFESGADHFVVETRMPGGIVLAPRGHEVLTRSAAAGLTLTRAEIDALVEGVRRVDTVFPTRHFDPNEQKRHALRRARCTSMAVALSEIRNHFILLHSRALR